MNRLHFIWLVFALSTLIIPPEIPAIDITLPSDIYEYTISGNGNNGDGYYYFDPHTYALFPTGRRGYAMILDSAGEVVWFMKPPPRQDTMANLNQYPGGYYIVCKGMGPRTESWVYDSNWNLVDFIPINNPWIDAVHDSHEIIRNADGTYWTDWVQYRTYDMSYVGGDPNALIGFDVIQLWDADHNVLWSWDSYDHIDELPIELMTEDFRLPYFEHLHVNSIYEYDNGDLLLSSRQMSTIHRIDRQTGRVLWNLGGGPTNDFTFIRGPGIPDYWPLDFYNQHDARQLDDGRISVYDNGNHHPFFVSYAREYILDEDNMTATLVWAYRTNPPEAASAMGGFQHSYDGHRVIGWGTMFADINITELDENDNVVFQIDLHDDKILWGWPPGLYRAHKHETFTASERPYVCAVVRNSDPDRLYCNWFGHEDEVFYYEIEGGLTPDTFEQWAIIQEGVWDLPMEEDEFTYYVRARALDAAGSPISDWSNVWPIRYQNDLLLLKATIDHIPPEGGNIEYSVNYRLDFPYELNNVSFWTEITAPNGTTYGPLYSATFDLTGYVEGLITGLTQGIPPLAPPGVYTFTGNFGRPGLACLSSSFYVFKQGIGGEAVDMQLADWPRGTGPSPGK